MNRDDYLAGGCALRVALSVGLAEAVAAEEMTTVCDRCNAVPKWSLPCGQWLAGALQQEQRARAQRQHDPAPTPVRPDDDRKAGAA